MDDATYSSETYEEARRVARLVLRHAGLSAGGLAAIVNNEDGDRRTPRWIRYRIREARDKLGVLIVSTPEGGYWIPTSREEAVRYAERCRKQGRRLFVLAAQAVGRADVASGEQFTLDLVTGEGPVAIEPADWDRHLATVAARLGMTVEQLRGAGATERGGDESRGQGESTEDASDDAAQ